jgi:hypothetical protein
VQSSSLQTRDSSFVANSAPFGGSVCLAEGGTAAVVGSCSFDSGTAAASTIGWHVAVAPGTTSSVALSEYANTII